MRPSYRRTPGTLHLEISAVVGAALLGWLLWPAPKTRTFPRLLPPPGVAYVNVDPQTRGSTAYPGFFAFSSPIGFGLSHAYGSAPTLRWQVSATLPFIPPYRYPDVSAPPLSYPDIPCLPLPSSSSDAYDPAAPAPKPQRSVTLDPVLQQRGLALPEALQAALIKTRTEAGDVRAFIRVARAGYVAEVVFPPDNNLPWENLRPLESYLRRARASAAEADTSGWVRVQWVLGDPAISPPSDIGK